MRACYGIPGPGGKVDNYWAANRNGAKACKARGIYCYLRAGQDPTQTADAFCNMIGHLEPGEFAICDHEEGSGMISPKGQRLLADWRDHHEPDSVTWRAAQTAIQYKTNQETRAKAFLSRVDQRLNTRCWYYSYEAFIRANVNLDALGPRPLWVAAYRATPPSVKWNLWQHTNAEAAAGIAQPCDCSIWPGDLNSLIALVGGDDLQLSYPMKRGLIRVAGLAFLGRHWNEKDHDYWARQIADDGSNLEIVYQTIEDSPEGQAWGKHLDALRNGQQGAPGPAGPPGPAYDDSALKAEVASLKEQLRAIK